MVSIPGEAGWGFTGSAPSWPSAVSKAPMKSWVFALNQPKIWSHPQESGYISLGGSLAGRIVGEKDVTHGRSIPGPSSNAAQYLWVK